MNPGSHLQNNTFKCVVIIFALFIIKVQSVPFSQNSDENNQETEMKVNISDSAIPAIDSIGLAKMESLEDTDPPEKDTKSVIGLGLQYLLSLAQKEEQKLSSTTTKAGETDTAVAVTDAAEDYIEIDFTTTSLPQMRKSTLRTRRRTSTTEKATEATTELLEEELEYEDELTTTTTPPPPKVPTKEEATDAILDVINVAIMFSQSGGTIATTTPTQRNRIRTRRTTTTTGSPEDYYYEEPEETTTPKRRRPIRPRSTLAPRTTSTVLPESTTTEKIAEDYNYVVETEETTTQRKRRPMRPRPTSPASTTTVVPTTKESVETEKTEKIPEDYNYVTAEAEETTTRRRRPVRPRSTLPPRKPTTNKVDIETTQNKIPEDYEYVEEPQETTTRRRRRRTRPTMTTSRTTKRPGYNPEPITAWAGAGGDEDEDEDEHDKPAVPGVPAAVLNNIQKFIVNVGTANVSGIVDQSLKIASLETVGTVVNTIQSGFLNLFGCTALDQLVGRCKIPPSG